MKTTLLSILLSVAALIRAAAGNDGLNLLQAEYSKPGVAESFAAGKAWFPFPAYEDRAGWAALFGPDAGKVIRRGEQLLDYQWQYIPASAYLAFERTGDRQAMEKPEGANRGALIALILAELAEGKGRFIDQLANGVWLAAQQKIAAECQPDTDGLVDKQLDGQHKDLPAHQNVGQIRDAEAAVFALQLVEPIVHIGCLQRIVFRYR